LFITEQFVEDTHVHPLYAAPQGVLGKRIVTVSDRRKKKIHKPLSSPFPNF
jgi:hypothetical protein